MMGINKRALWSRCVCVAVILMISGCAATVAMMPETLDVEAKRFSPPPDKANIYVVRPSYFAGSAVLIQVYLDGKILGSVAPGTYLLFEVDPGANKIEVITKENQDAVTLNTEAGENYFVFAVSQWGWWTARARLIELDEEDGRKAVEESKRAQPLGLVPLP